MSMIKLKDLVNPSIEIAMSEGKDEVGAVVDPLRAE